MQQQRIYAYCCLLFIALPHNIFRVSQGIDLGILTGEARLAAAGEKPPRTVHRLIELADDASVTRLETTVTEDEKGALAYVTERARKAKDPITIHRCEFQFDKRKLTLHYSSSVSRPDFRQLCHYAFREYSCRIWMNNCQPPAGQPGELLCLQGPVLPRAHLNHLRAQASTAPSSVDTTTSHPALCAAAAAAAEQQQQQQVLPQRRMMLPPMPPLLLL